MTMTSTVPVSLTSLTLSALAIAATSPAAAISLATGYKYERFDIPGATFVTVNAINNIGQIAGQKAENGPATGFFGDSDGEIRFFNPPGSYATAVWDMNDAGTIVGYSFRDDSFLKTEPYIYNSSQFYTPDLFPGSNFPDVEFSSINNAGQIVGFYYTDLFWNPYDVHGFLLNADDFSTLSPDDVTPITIAGASQIFPWGINDAGKITGHFNDTNGTHGFLLEGEQLTQLNIPGADRTRPSAINNKDSIIGVFTLPETGRNSYSFIWNNGQFQELAFPNALSTRVLDMNDAGVIVGRYQDADGKFYGFRATPVPEPSMVFALVGLGVVVFLGDRQKRL